MNKTHRLIWSDARQTWIVAHEAAATRGKPATRARRLAATLASTVIAQAAFAQTPAPNTLPSGGQVVAGQASIAQSGSAMTITQGSDRAILNWNSFSIGSGASVNFQQPSASAVALNRVIGSDPSRIYGSLSANGQVFLVNPSGVLFAAGARVDVGGMVASTLGIRNEDFLAGNYRFSRDGASGSVVNQGELVGKYVALLAPEVQNEGVIATRMGTTALAAGEAVTLGISGNALIDVQVEKASIDTLVANKHLIQADGGTAILSAQSAHILLGQVVNSGAIEAKGISTDGGTVRLLASSTIDHSGNINVSAAKVGAGGTAIVLADLANPNSQTTVSGSLSAKGGSEAGDGGFIETSGTHLKIEDSAKIDTRAANGKTGTWLLDPEDFTIAAAGGDLSGAALSGLLATSNITIQTTPALACLEDFGPCAGVFPLMTPGNGDIFVNDAVTWNAPTSLTLSAYRNIEVNNTITASDAASAIFLLFGQEISGVYKTNGSGSITNGSGGDPTVYAPDGTLLTGAKLQASYTSNPTAFVKLNSGQSSTYGSAPTLNYTAYDKIDLTAAPGTLATGTGGTWESAPFTALGSTTAAGTTNYLYAGGLPNTSFFFIPAGFESWTVNKATVTLSAATKTYDGSATLGSGLFTVTGVPGQTLLYSGATASSAHVGGPDGNTGTADNFISALTLLNGTGLASNYQLPTLNVANAPVTITPRTVGLSATKTYDGTTTLGAGTVTITTGVTGESLAYSGATSNDAHVATAGKFINAITLDNNGAFLASDYQLPVLNPANAPVTINAATLLYVADRKTMTSGTDLPAFTGSVTGVAATDTLDGVTDGSAVFSSTATKSSPANTYAIDGSGLTLTSTDYVLAQAAGNATALTINATRFTSIADLIAALLKDRTTAKQVSYSIGLVANSKQRNVTWGSGIIKSYSTQLTDLIKKTCPDCAFSEDSIAEWLSGGTGKSAATLQDVWALQYKHGVDANKGKGLADYRAKGDAIEAMTRLGYTASDFKAAGFPISALIVAADPSTSFGFSKKEVVVGSKITEQTTSTNSETTTAKLAFTKDELLAAGYTEDEIAQATTTAAGLTETTDIIASTSSTKVGSTFNRDMNNTIANSAKKNNKI
ncbi:MAG: filamentous hemagglutinin N-terminal domain-containing protein [Gammaproteobacteria bacterium]|nr:filamentous hemagglutinin N-terminal domain-containing protein [Gammaproteobacteria bacterium]MBU1645449.1 filamentous hemagglutinin N-terminal domain-containing protein [Gammaproteobacteria bacterium]MBU1971072.1 filamentous hemagglutinin N-terminal domain-containing protein [Gammaproteobacteria bacterium]